MSKKGENQEEIDNKKHAAYQCKMQLVDVNRKSITYKENNMNIVNMKLVTVKKNACQKKITVMITATINA